MKPVSIRELLERTSVGSKFYTTQNQKQVSAVVYRQGMTGKVKTRVVFGIDPKSEQTIKLTEVEILSD